ncbi:hypothetical protein [Burkholderia cenocepacia]|uniref:hypothetical protein n=1 Tax=Burkholderia cenocepacia TaxID=95486 RepID=UPI00158AFE9D|nr:hypothetical protein [Burkholderia cenocepacia]
MPRTTKILTLATFFCLLSASQAGEGFYVPIHNLAPISYNPLTTNYNPDYDNYPGLMAKQSQVGDQAGSTSTSSVTNAKSSQIAELQAKLEQLKQQRNENTKKLMNSSIGEMMTRSVQGNQINTEIQNLEDRLTTLMTGQAPVRVINQAAPRRSINCYTYGLGNAFTTCN